MQKLRIIVGICVNSWAIENELSPFFQFPIEQVPAAFAEHNYSTLLGESVNETYFGIDYPLYKGRFAVGIGLKSQIDSVVLYGFGWRHGNLGFNIKTIPMRDFIHEIDVDYSLSTGMFSTWARMNSSSTFLLDTNAKIWKKPFQEGQIGALFLLSKNLSLTGALDLIHFKSGFFGHTSSIGFAFNSDTTSGFILNPSSRVANQEKWLRQGLNLGYNLGIQELESTQMFHTLSSAYGFNWQVGYVEVLYSWTSSIYEKKSFHNVDYGLSWNYLGDFSAWSFNIQKQKNYWDKNKGSLWNTGFEVRYFLFQP